MKEDTFVLFAFFGLLFGHPENIFLLCAIFQEWFYLEWKMSIVKSTVKFRPSAVFSRTKTWGFVAVSFPKTDSQRPNPELNYLKVVSGNTRAIGTISRSLWTLGRELFWAMEIKRQLGVSHFSGLSLQNFCKRKTTFLVFHFSILGYCLCYSGSFLALRSKFYP